MLRRNALAQRTNREPIILSDEELALVLRALDSFGDATDDPKEMDLAITLMVRLNTECYVLSRGTIAHMNEIRKWAERFVLLRKPRENLN